MQDTLRDAKAVDDLITVRISPARQRNRAGQPMLIERERFANHLWRPFAKHLIHKLLDALIHWRQILRRQILQLTLNYPHHFTVFRRAGIEIHPQIEPAVQIVFLILSHKKQRINHTPARNGPQLGNARGVFLTEKEVNIQDYHEITEVVGDSFGKIDCN
jgi:hypothetical protein